MQCQVPKALLRDAVRKSDKNLNIAAAVLCGERLGATNITGSTGGVKGFLSSIFGFGGAGEVEASQRFLQETYSRAGTIGENTSSSSSSSKTSGVDASENVGVASQIPKDLTRTLLNSEKDMFLDSRKRRFYEDWFADEFPEIWQSEIKQMLVEYNYDLPKVYTLLQVRLEQMDDKKTPPGSGSKKSQTGAGSRSPSKEREEGVRTEGAYPLRNTGGGVPAEVRGGVVVENRGKESWMSRLKGKLGKEAGNGGPFKSPEEHSAMRPVPLAKLLLQEQEDRDRELAKLVNQEEHDVLKPSAPNAYIYLPVENANPDKISAGPQTGAGAGTEIKINANAPAAFSGAEAFLFGDGKKTSTNPMLGVNSGAPKIPLGVDTGSPTNNGDKVDTSATPEGKRSPNGGRENGLCGVRRNSGRLLDSDQGSSVLMDDEMGRNLEVEKQKDMDVEAARIAAEAKEFSLFMSAEGLQNLNHQALFELEQKRKREREQRELEERVAERKKEQERQRKNQKMRLVAHPQKDLSFFFECQCCYMDDVTGEEAAQCSLGEHIVCRECVSRYIDQLVGNQFGLMVLEKNAQAQRLLCFCNAEDGNPCLGHISPAYISKEDSERLDKWWARRSLMIFNQKAQAREKLKQVFSLN